MVMNGSSRDHTNRTYLIVGKKACQLITKLCAISELYSETKFTRSSVTAYEIIQLVVHTHCLVRLGLEVV